MTILDKFEAHPSMVTEVPKPLMTMDVEVAFPAITIKPAFGGIVITSALVLGVVQMPPTQTKSAEGRVAMGQVVG